MNRIVIALLFFCLGAGVATAQDSREQERRERLEKRAKNLAKDLKLEDGTSVWFQNLYVEYQTQLSDVRRAAARKMPRPEKNDETGDEDGTSMREKEMKKLTGEQAEQALLASFERQEKELALKKDYYKRFSEKLTPKQLVRIFIPRPHGGQTRQGGRGGFPGGPGPHFGPGPRF